MSWLGVVKLKKQIRGILFGGIYLICIDSSMNTKIWIMDEVGFGDAYLL